MAAAPRTPSLFRRGLRRRPESDTATGPLRACGSRGRQSAALASALGSRLPTYPAAAVTRRRLTGRARPPGRISGVLASRATTRADGLGPAMAPRWPRVTSSGAVGQSVARPLPVAPGPRPGQARPGGGGVSARVPRDEAWLSRPGVAGGGLGSAPAGGTTRKVRPEAALCLHRGVTSRLTRPGHAERGGGGSLGAVFGTRHTSPRHAPPPAGLQHQGEARRG